MSYCDGVGDESDEVSAVVVLASVLVTGASGVLAVALASEVVTEANVAAGARMRSITGAAGLEPIAATVAESCTPEGEALSE